MEAIAEDLASKVLEYLSSILPENDLTNGALGDKVLVKALAAYRVVLKSNEEGGV